MIQKQKNIILNLRKKNVLFQMAYYEYHNFVQIMEALLIKNRKITKSILLIYGIFMIVIKINKLKIIVLIK